MRRKNNNNFKKKSKQVLTVKDSSDIPQLQTQPVFHRVLRFVNAASVQIQPQLNCVDLICALGMIGVTNSEAHSIAATCKIKKIDIWAVPKSDSDGAWQEAWIDWHNSTSFASGKKFGDVSISNARPLHVSSKPPKESVCNFWMQNGTIEYCTVSVPPGGIIDVHVSFTMADRITMVQSIPLFYTVGEMKYGKLDQTAGGSLIPVGLEF